METKAIYFEDVTKDNTDETFRLARLRAAERGIKNIAVASTRGDTAIKAVSFFSLLRSQSPRDCLQTPAMRLDY